MSPKLRADLARSVADIDALMDITQTRLFLGGVSKMTVHRWLADDALGFPHPIQISGRNYWKRRALLDFVARQEAKTPPRARSSVKPTGDPPPQATGDAGLP